MSGPFEVIGMHTHIRCIHRARADSGDDGKRMFNSHLSRNLGDGFENPSLISPGGAPT